jgi:hypothetical protein
VYKLCKDKICGGSAPAPPAETAVSARCARILSILISVFASLFAKSEWVSGQRPEHLKKEKNVFCTFSTDERCKKGNAKKLYKVSKEFCKVFFLLTIQKLIGECPFLSTDAL